MIRIWHVGKWGTALQRCCPMESGHDYGDVRPLPTSSRTGDGVNSSQVRAGRTSYWCSRARSRCGGCAGMTSRTYDNCGPCRRPSRRAGRHRAVRVVPLAPRREGFSYDVGDLSERQPTAAGSRGRRRARPDRAAAKPANRLTVRTSGYLTQLLIQDQIMGKSRSASRRHHRYPTPAGDPLPGGHVGHSAAVAPIAGRARIPVVGLRRNPRRHRGRGTHSSRMRGMQPNCPLIVSSSRRPAKRPSTQAGIWHMAQISTHVDKAAFVAMVRE